MKIRIIKTALTDSEPWYQYHFLNVIKTLYCSLKLKELILGVRDMNEYSLTKISQNMVVKGK